MAIYHLSADDALHSNQLAAEVFAAHGIRIAGPTKDDLIKHSFSPPRTITVASEFDAVDLTATIAAHAPDPDWGISPATQARRQEEADLIALRTKAKAVYAETDTFTNAQVQKIVAGLALRAIRNLLLTD